MLLSDQLVNKLCEPGHEAVAALPASEVDTVTDAGLAGAFKDPRLWLMLPTALTSRHGSAAPRPKGPTCQRSACPVFIGEAIFQFR